jgi:hypothetical protein
MDAHESAQHSPERPPRRFGPVHALWLASPLGIPVLHAISPSLPEPVRALAGLGFLLLVPGWLLHLLIYPRARIGLAARLSRTFALSIAVSAALGLVAWFIGGAGGPAAIPAPPAGSGPPPAPPLPPVAGRLTGVLYMHVAWLLVGSILLVIRDRRQSRHPDGFAGSERERFDREFDTLSDLPALRAAASGRGAPAAGGPDAAADRAAGRGWPTLAQAPAGVGPDGEPVAVGSGLDPANPKMRRIIHEAYRLGDQHKVDHPIAPRWATLIVLGVIMLTGAILGLYAGGILGYETDAPDHIACLREMVERDRILPRTTFYADGDGVATDSRKGFFHVALASAALLTGTDPVRLWNFMPGLLIPLALVVFHSYARRLLRSEGTALFATFLALVCYAEVTRGPFARLGYGSHMGIVLAWATLTLALDFVMARPRRTHLGLLALAAFAATATHFFACLLVLFSLSVYLVAMLALRRRTYTGTRRLAVALLVTVAGSLPAIAWRLAYTLPALNPIHTHRQGILYFTDSLFIILPSEWVRFLFGAGFGAIVLSLFLWKRAREDDALLYLASLSIAPLLVAANPLVVPLLEPHLGYLVARFVQAVPFLMVLAYMARWMGESLLELTSARRILVSLVFYLFMVVLLFPRLEAFARSFSASSLEAQRARSVLVWDDLLAKLRAEIPTPAVILSDPLTSYSIPALTRHSTVAVLNQHGSPSDSLALVRLAACRDVLSPYIGTGEKARLCRRFGVDYVLVNGTFDQPLSTFYCSVGPEQATAQRRALDADTGLFRRVWSLGERGALYRVRSEGLDVLAGIVRPGQERPFSRTTEELTRGVFVRQIPPEAFDVVADTLAGVTLMAAHLDTTLTERGDVVDATFYWRRAGQPPQFPVEAHLRLDTEAPRGRLWSLGWSKLHRRLAQRRRGVLYRMDQVHVPLAGMLGGEHWPEDRYVVDRVRLPIPRRAAIGEYELKVSWQQQTMLPNIRFRDYFTDRDAYDGLAVGFLEVY